jgi:phage terminase large subunit-like protein
MALTTAETSHYRRLLEKELARKRRIAEKYDWGLHARPKQQIPEGNWSKVIWQAGRGFGKSRCIMEFARYRAKAERTRGILVARTAADIRDVLIDGESGIMAISPPDFRPKYEPTKRRLTWPNGSIAVCLSADEPDSLRGPQCLIGSTQVMMADGSSKPIDSIVAGEFVQTRKGSGRVLKTWCSSLSAKTFQLLDSSGRVVIGTGQHPVFVVGKGFTALSSVSPGDCLCVMRASSGEEESGTKRQRTRKQAKPITTKPRYGCIARSGRKKTDRSRRGSLSTTKTGISTTTRSRTLNASLSPGTTDCIAGRRLPHTDIYPQPLSLNGNTRTMRGCCSENCSVASAGSSIRASQRGHPDTAPFTAQTSFVTGLSNQKTESASAAGRIILRGEEFRSFAPNSATQTPAANASRVTGRDQSRSGSPAITVRKNSAARVSTRDSAAINVPSTTTARIVSVSPLTLRQPVYDIEVEDAHEFFANGILVHNCHWAACDEIAAWKYIASWSNLMFGLRLPSRLGPQVAAATTPKPCPLLAELKADAKKNPHAVIIIGGSTYENRENLDPKFFADITTRYEGTRLGRQELDGELLEDIPGALWTQQKMDDERVLPGEEPEMQRIVVAIDPSTTSGEESNECGISASGRGVDNHLYVLADRSGIMTPLEWANAAISLYHELHADAVIGEANNGGDLIETTLRFIDPTIPYRKVNASRGKTARAEPISALAEQQRWHLVGKYAELEKQLCLMTGEGFTGAGSPDRADAMVWACSELMGASGSVQMFPDFRARWRGQSEPKHAVHVVSEVVLKDWWPRWISAMCGQNSAAHWWAREPDGRVRIYRELIMKDAPAEEFGAAIADLSKREVAGSRIVAVWMGDSAFELAAGKSQARSLYSGLSRAVGAHKSFLFVHDERERAMEENVHRIQSIRNRLSAMPKGTLSVQSIKSAAASAKDQSGWDVVREMLRWRAKDSLVRRDVPDMDYAMELAYTDQPAYHEYMRVFADSGAEEVLPALTIAAECQGLIQAMSGASRSTADQEKLAESNFWYLLQSLRIGALASRDESGEEPIEEFVGRRLDTLQPDAAPMSRHMVCLKAEADWRNRHGNSGPMNFMRQASGRGRIPHRPH